MKVTVIAQMEYGGTIEQAHFAFKNAASRIGDVRFVRTVSDNETITSPGAVYPSHEIARVLGMRIQEEEYKPRLRVVEANLNDAAAIVAKARLVLPLDRWEEMRKRVLAASMHAEAIDIIGEYVEFE